MHAVHFRGWIAKLAAMPQKDPCSALKLVNSALHRNLYVDSRNEFLGYLTTTGFITSWRGLLAI